MRVERRGRRRKEDWDICKESYTNISTLTFVSIVVSGCGRSPVC